MSEFDPPGKMTVGTYLKAWDTLGFIQESDLDEITHGAIDTHVHAYPDVRVRPSIIDVAKRASVLGMAGVVYKCHFTVTAGAAWIVDQWVSEWCKERNLKPARVWGGMVLNSTVGGYSPETVEIVSRFPGAKVVWTPTLTGREHRERVGGEKGVGVYALTEHGELKPEVIQILDILSHSKQRVALAMGHVSPEETIAIAKEAKSKGVKVLVDHVLQRKPTVFTTEQIKLLSTFAYIGFASTSSIEGLGSETAKLIEQVGPERTILQTDYGQIWSPLAPDGFRFLMREMLGQGFTKREVQKMVNDNPRDWLSLAPEP